MQQRIGQGVQGGPGTDVQAAPLPNPPLTTASGIGQGFPGQGFSGQGFSGQGNPSWAFPIGGSINNTWFDFTNTDPTKVYQQPKTNEQDYTSFVEEWREPCSVPISQKTMQQSESEIKSDDYNRLNLQGTGQQQLPFQQNFQGQGQTYPTGSQVQQGQEQGLQGLGQQRFGQQGQQRQQQQGFGQQGQQGFQGLGQQRFGQQEKEQQGTEQLPQQYQSQLIQEKSSESGPCKNLFKINVGFVDNMKIPARFFANQYLQQDAYTELGNWIQRGGTGALPSLIELANITALPGIVDVVGFPNLQPGFGFPRGCVTAFDMDNPNAIISPNGVGVDINNGVRLLKTNLLHGDVMKSNKMRQLADELYGSIPLGIGANRSIYTTTADLKRALQEGMNWALDRGYVWEDDLKKCEDGGRLDYANSNLVTFTALLRAKSELGSLGSGGHYVEVQAVSDIYDKDIAAKLGLTQIGQICVMIKSGSRGFGFQVAKDYVRSMSNQSDSSTFQYVGDPKIVGAKINSQLGKDYLSAVASACNFAWVNRSGLAHIVRQSFETVFGDTPKNLEMFTVLDNNYNSILQEEYQGKKLLIHRNGAARAYPVNHPCLPESYRDIGSPILLDGGMGTSSYIVIGVPENIDKTYCSTCSGAGRAMTRNRARLSLYFEDVQSELSNAGIIARLGNRRFAVEEAPENFKDIDEIIQTCEEAGINKKIIRLAPVAIIRC